MKTEIKSAETLEEMQVLRPLFQEFFTLAKLPGTYDADVEQRLVDLVASGVGAVFFADINGNPVGVLGAVAVDDLFTGRKYCHELFWFVAPDLRGRPEVGGGLLTVYEAFARASGASVVRLTALSHLREEAVGRLYSRRGYLKRESHWEKTY